MPVFQRLGLRGAFLLFIGVPCLLFTGAALAWQAFYGEAELVFVAPEDAKLLVEIDGQPTSLAEGTHQRISVKQGAHALKLESRHGRSTRTVEVKSGFDKLLVPAADDQCFVLLDVSKSNYEYGAKPAEKFPRVSRRIGAKEVVDLPASTYFTEAELPRSLKEGNSCELLLEVHCDALKLADAELFTMLGFE